MCLINNRYVVMENNTNKKISFLLQKFLKDLAGKETDFVYEITCCDPEKGFVTTYRSKDLFYIIEKIEKNAPTRNIYISPYCTRYPEHSGNFIYKRQMKSSNAVVIDIDAIKGKIDYKIVLDQLKKHNIPKPTYLISSGKGCHLWYMLENHVGQGSIRLIYEKIRNKIASIDWGNCWKIDDLSIKQQFRIPFTINHKYNKLVLMVNRGEKIKNAPQTFTKPATYTKKEMKRFRKNKTTKIDSKANQIAKIELLQKPKRKRKLKTKIKTEESPKNRFLQGSEMHEIKLKQKICVDESKFKRIIQLLSYGKSYLSCRVAGEALGISYKAAARFLRKCVNYGYLEIFESDHSAYSYKIKINYEMKRKELPKRCSIDGPGQSNKAMCRLARQAYKYGLNKIETVEKWIHRFYRFTSGEHEPEELVHTYLSVYDKFESGRYKIYGAT